MTFFDLLLWFQNKYGTKHQNIFFDLVFFLSKKVKSKLLFVENKTSKIDFTKQKFVSLCNKYFNNNVSLAHLTKQASFCNLIFHIDKKVLAPREITEQMTNDFIKYIKKKSKTKIFDLCAGSGNIGISIKKYCPKHEIVCLDKYQYCINNIKKNCQFHKVEIKVVKEDVFTFLNKNKQIDYIISNPPYIDKNHDKYVVNTTWENKDALFAKDHGLFFFKKYFIWLSKSKYKECWLEYSSLQKQRLIRLLKKYPKLQYKFVKNYLIVFNKI